MPALPKALIFTDLHITRPGETIIGLDPLARFQAALAQAIARHGDATHVIVLGDLTHTGHPEEYARLRAALAPCPVPVTLTLGNHDARPAFRAAFPQDAGRAHMQSALDLGDLRLLVLDTHDDAGRAPPHGGWLCAARLAWLDAEVARTEAEGRGTVVLCHHPAFATGFDGMDAIALANAPALMSRLKRAGVRHLICGHIHRAIHLSVDGLPASVLKSPCHQMPLRLGPADIHTSVDEPGGYGVLLARGTDTILHGEDVA